MMNRISFLFLAFAMALAFSACQIKPKPTEIKETASPVEDPASYAARILDSKPAIIDVRSDMDFAMSHIPGSVNVRWEDLNSVNTREKGLLDPDRLALARRMSLWGIDPKTSVLIVGMGPEGRGEEGRVGWALRLLGHEKVETASIRLFRQQNARETESRPENKTIWKPETRNELEVKPAEFENLAYSSVVAPVSKARAGALQNAAHLGSSSPRIILDVSHPNERDVKAFEEMRSAGRKPAWKVIHSTWRAFYDEAGRGSCSQTAGELDKLGATAQHEILIIDGDGVGAAAVGFVLDSCRYGKPRVLSSGLRSLELKK